MLFISLSNSRHLSAPCESSRRAHKARSSVQRASTHHGGMRAHYTDQACAYARTGQASAHAGTNRQGPSFVQAQTRKCLHVTSRRSERTVPSTQEVDRIAGHCQHGRKVKNLMDLPLPISDACHKHTPNESHRAQPMAGTRGPNTRYRKKFAI